MGSFFIEFRDPLFSVIVLVAIVFAISFFSYWWGRYRAKDNYRFLDRFLEQFDALPSKEHLGELIRSSDLSSKSWLLLADAYIKNGDFEKAIEVYTELLRLEEGIENAKEIMFLLGKTYFKAGFLGRSRDVFLEILKKSPRTPQVLHYLLLVYEYMRDYNAALEVLEPLDALEEDISKERLYLRVLALLNAVDIDEELKKREIVFFYKEHKMFERMVFGYLFRVDPKTAWGELDLKKAPKIADILWNLDKRNVDYDIIAKSEFLQELYSAKGYVQNAVGSEVFELDLLIKLPKDAGVTVGFEYLCQNCKVVFPFSFDRCNACHHIDTLALEYTLQKDHQRELSEAGNSFL